MNLQRYLAPLALVLALGLPSLAKADDHTDSSTIFDGTKIFIELSGYGVFPDANPRIGGSRRLMLETGYGGQISGGVEVPLGYDFFVEGAVGLGYSETGVGSIKLIGNNQKFSSSNEFNTFILIGELRAGYEILPWLSIYGGGGVGVTEGDLKISAAGAAVKNGSINTMVYRGEAGVRVDLCECGLYGSLFGGYEVIDTFDLKAQTTTKARLEQQRNFLAGAKIRYAFEP